MKAAIDPGYAWWGWMTAEEWRLTMWLAFSLAKYDGLQREGIEPLVAEAAKRLLGDGFKYELLSLSEDGQVMVDGDYPMLCSSNVLTGSLLRYDPDSMPEFEEIGRVALSMRHLLGVESKERVESLWDEFYEAMSHHIATAQEMVH